MIDSCWITLPTDLDSQALSYIPGSLVHKGRTMGDEPEYEVKMFMFGGRTEADYWVPAFFLYVLTAILWRAWRAVPFLKRVLRRVCCLGPAEEEDHEESDGTYKKKVLDVGDIGEAAMAREKRERRESWELSNSKFEEAERWARIGAKPGGKGIFDWGLSPSGRVRGLISPLRKKGWFAPKKNPEGLPFDDPSTPFDPSLMKIERPVFKAGTDKSVMETSPVPSTPERGHHRRSRSLEEGSPLGGHHVQRDLDLDENRRFLTLWGGDSRALRVTGSGKAPQIAGEPIRVGDGSRSHHKFFQDNVKKNNMEDRLPPVTEAGMIAGRELDRGSGVALPRLGGFVGGGSSWGESVRRRMGQIGSAMNAVLVPKTEIRMETEEESRKAINFVSVPLTFDGGYTSKNIGDGRAVSGLSLERTGTHLAAADHLPERGVSGPTFPGGISPTNTMRKLRALSPMNFRKQGFRSGLPPVEASPVDEVEDDRDEELLSPMEMGLRCIDSVENQSVHRSQRHRSGASEGDQSDSWSGSLVLYCLEAIHKHRTVKKDRSYVSSGAGLGAGLGATSE